MNTGPQKASQEAMTDDMWGFDSTLRRTDCCQSIEAALFLGADPIQTIGRTSSLRAMGMVVSAEPIFLSCFRRKQPNRFKYGA